MRVLWVNKRVLKWGDTFRGISNRFRHSSTGARVCKMADTELLQYIFQGNSESNDAKSHGVTMQKNEVARASSKYLLYQ